MINFFFNDTATTEIYTLSLRDALPIWSGVIFILLSVFNIRTEIMRAIPSQLRYGVAIGIGLFLALLGFADHSNFIQHTPDDLGGVPIVVLGNLFPDDGTIVERLLHVDHGMLVFLFEIGRAPS